MEVSIFDSNHTVIRMDDPIGRLIKSGNKKVLTNVDKVADFVIGVLELVCFLLTLLVH